MSNGSPGASPVSVPLYPQYIAGTGYKVGIYVGFAADSFRPYEFDTGGIGFWSGYSPQWWPKSSQAQPAVQNHYASGTTYNGVAVPATVYFADPSQTRAALQGQATVAQILTATGHKAADWQETIDAGGAPLFKAFYGDFGASMLAKQGLKSVLLQLSDGPGNGFAVTLGDFPPQNQAGTGSLQIGLTEQDVAGAANRIPLTAQAEGPFAQGVLSIDGTTINQGGGPGGGAAEPPPVNVLFDSGAPVTHIWTGPHLPADALLPYAAGGKVDAKGKGTLAPGHRLTLASGGVTILDFVTGTVAGQNEVVFSPAAASPGNPGNAEGYVNTGIQPFFGRTITFYPGTGTDGFIALSPPVAGG
jgi:hypothetical protein